MPQIGGYDATKEIRKQHPNLPIIAQTAYVNTEDKDKAIAFGFNDFLQKPLNMTNLMSTIEKQWK